jgi:hypothetical protein
MVPGPGGARETLGILSMLCHGVQASWNLQEEHLEAPMELLMDQIFGSSVFTTPACSSVATVTHTGQLGRPARGPIQEPNSGDQLGRPALKLSSGVQFRSPV